VEGAAASPIPLCSPPAHHTSATVVKAQPHLVFGGRVAVLEHVGACLAQGDLDVVGAVGIDAHDQHAGAHHVAGDRDRAVIAGKGQGQLKLHGASSRSAPSLACWALYPVGARYSVTSCDLRVLMDQPTESISSRDLPGRQVDRLIRPEF
jgi:hypothetical protein